MSSLVQVLGSEHGYDWLRHQMELGGLFSTWYIVQSSYIIYSSLDLTKSICKCPLDKCPTFHQRIMLLQTPRLGLVSWDPADERRAHAVLR